jgi:hypothetical protein
MLKEGDVHFELKKIKIKNWTTTIERKFLTVFVYLIILVMDMSLVVKHKGRCYYFLYVTDYCLDG